MNEIFAVVCRGLEQLCAEEMARVPGISNEQVSYRRVTARVDRGMDKLLDLRTVDDIFLDVGKWDGIPAQRVGLARLKELSGKLQLQQAVKTITTLRVVSSPPSFSVTANFVGKRNYSSEEIKLAVSQGITVGYPWRYTSEDQSDLNIRVFIEHDLAFVGLRLGAAPLHDRTYKQEHIPGSLKPTIASAMLMLAEIAPGERILDPFCGAGTILIEAALQGARSAGGDQVVSAIQAAIANARTARQKVDLQCWDARQLPLSNGSIDRIVTNLPWGRQVEVDQEISGLYRGVCAEFERVLSPGGQVVLLTSLADLIHFEQLKLRSAIPISLFGQQPVILKYSY